jgi:CRP-like cAMP-binding protein
MASVEFTRLLAQSKPFRGLHTAELEAVFQAAQRRQVERNAFFFHQGDPATAFYVLTDGEAKLTQVTAEGHQILVRFVGPGEEFGVIAALSNAVYTLSAQAVEDCLALAWDGETVAHMMERYPRFVLNVLDLLVGHYK